MKSRENLNIEELEKLYEETLMKRDFARFVGIVLLFIILVSLGMIVLQLIVNTPKIVIDKTFTLSMILVIFSGTIILLNRSIRRALE